MTSHDSGHSSDIRDPCGV